MSRVKSISPAAYFVVSPKSLILDYATRLQLFQLEPLKETLLRADLLTFHRINYGRLIVPSFKNSFNKRARLLFAFVHFSKQRRFFTHRVLVLWNKLSSSVPGVASANSESTILSAKLSTFTIGRALKALELCAPEITVK